MSREEWLLSMYGDDEKLIMREKGDILLGGGEGLTGTSGESSSANLLTHNIVSEIKLYIDYNCKYSSSMNINTGIF